MLTNSDQLKVLEIEPAVTYFYEETRFFYTVSHDDDNYMVALAEANVEGNPDVDRFLIIHYPPEIFDLLQQADINIRKFFKHPSNSVHNVLVEYDEEDEPHVVLGVLYDDNSAIPNKYLPTADIPWLYILDPE